ncbi:hypothetical protein DB41_AF00030 [Neochlamydia sp. TUME1]|nr:hypothetical protein DB41_AF00030 [Neochlamydia sp. TUME1]
MTSVANRCLHLVQTLNNEGLAQTFKIGANISLGKWSMVIEELGFMVWSLLSFMPIFSSFWSRYLYMKKAK